MGEVLSQAHGEPKAKSIWAGLNNQECSSGTQRHLNGITMSTTHPCCLLQSLHVTLMLSAQAPFMSVLGMELGKEPMADTCSVDKQREHHTRHIALSSSRPNRPVHPFNRVETPFPRTAHLALLLLELLTGTTRFFTWGVLRINEEN